MKVRYVHTNIVTKNWQQLAEFYQKSLDCERLDPPLHIEGKWLADGTAVPNAHLQGIHLRLPGYGTTGPTLELFEYTEQISRPEPSAANRAGYGHMAFEVDNVESVRQRILTHGGQDLGLPVVHSLSGHGTITFTYMTDPEGNIIELQSWDRVSRYGVLDT